MRKIRGNDMAMIFQEPLTSLNPVFTVGDQIAEQVKLHMKVSQKEARDRAIEMLRLVGIPSPERRAKQYPHELSGGMRQRVMIAMALSCEPKLLIADEPTTALDVTVQAQILELLKAIQERTGAALLLITHDLGVVAEMVDNVDRDVRRPGRGAGDRRGGAPRAPDAVHDGPASSRSRPSRSAAAGCRRSRASCRRRSTCRRPAGSSRAARTPGRPAGPCRPSCTPSGASGRRSRCHLHLARRARAPRGRRSPQHDENMTIGRRDHRRPRQGRSRMTADDRRRHPSPSPIVRRRLRRRPPASIRNGRALMLLRSPATGLHAALFVAVLGVLIGAKGAVERPAAGGRRHDPAGRGLHRHRAPDRNRQIWALALAVLAGACSRLVFGYLIVTMGDRASGTRTPCSSLQLVLAASPFVFAVASAWHFLRGARWFNGEREQPLPARGVRAPGRSRPR